MIYLSGEFSVVFAVDASEGTLLWTYDPQVRAVFSTNPELSFIARAHRGVAVWEGKVFVTTADCRLIALDASDGNPLWSKTTCDTALDYFISDSPYVGGGKVFVGNGGSESQKKNRGFISAYDASDGELAWRFFIVPSDNPAENNTAALELAASTWSVDTLATYGGGGHSWNEMTYDPSSNQLFFGTSGAYPYIHAERSPAGGENLFLSSIVAVNAVSRQGGSLPDLRYATQQTHQSWDAIVIDGSRPMNGMPGVEISIEQAQAIRSYVLSLSGNIRTSAQ